MASQEFAVRLEVPWKEPIGLKEPTAEQWSSGVVVVMKQSIFGPEQSLRKNEHFLMDAEHGNRLVERGTARYETEREERIAKAEGHRRPNRGVKAPAPAKAKGKAKAKAEDTPEEG